MSLVGCPKSHMMVKPTASQFGPVNKQFGLIKYRLSTRKRDANREHAFKQMYETCQGKYKIISEKQETVFGGMVPIGNMMIADNDEYMFIEFECLN